MERRTLLFGLLTAPFIRLNEPEPVLTVEQARQTFVVSGGIDAEDINKYLGTAVVNALEVKR